MLYPSVSVNSRRRFARVMAAVLIVSAAFALTACDSLERFAIKSQRSITNFFSFGGEEEYTAQELALNGMEAYERGNYRAAARNFQELKDFYPFSQYAALADLKLGDSYYQRQQYDKAVEAYEEFERLHPRNEAIPYVIYKTGLCYFDRMPSVDRDQTFARKAMETFLRLQQQFPGNEYSVLTEPMIPECIRKLAGHEFSIGLFYFETRHWVAAKQRFEKVLRNYPDVGYHRESMIYIADCDRRIAADETLLAGSDVTTDLTVPLPSFVTVGEEELAAEGVEILEADGQVRAFDENAYEAAEYERTYVLEEDEDAITATDREIIEAIAPDLHTSDIPNSEGTAYPDL